MPVQHSGACRASVPADADPVRRDNSYTPLDAHRLADTHQRDLLELLDDRYDKAATMITSQLPVDRWHAYLGDPTLADAILDRLVHNAHRIALKGESMRARRSQPALQDPPTQEPAALKTT